MPISYDRAHRFIQDPPFLYALDDRLEGHENGQEEVISQGLEYTNSMHEGVCSLQKYRILLLL